MKGQPLNMFFEDSRCDFDPTTLELITTRSSHSLLKFCCIKWYQSKVSILDLDLQDVMRVDLIECESCMISRSKSGLRWDIEEKVALKSFFKLNDIIMASKHAEALLEKEKTRTKNSINVSAFQPDRSRPSHISSTTSNGRLTTSVNPYIPSSIPKCYRCNDDGHKSNVCPKRGAVNFTKAIDEDEIKVGKDHEEIQKNSIKGEEEENFGHSLVIQRLMYAPKKEEPP
ncbi:unnamed protein product [Spirodela intermedia]|uniref:CCHC-type domain-containing protein n=1 Tax=Spirodela intermedia TaxID=51605 RepID=A0ABN7EC14_SPIIN|nr:unnamed protein product [Spirodela intermedia]